VGGSRDSVHPSVDLLQPGQRRDKAAEAGQAEAGQTEAGQTERNRHSVVPGHCSFGRVNAPSRPSVP